MSTTKTFSYEWKKSNTNNDISISCYKIPDDEIGSDKGKNFSNYTELVENINLVGGRAGNNDGWAIRVDWPDEIKRLINNNTTITRMDIVFKLIKNDTTTYGAKAPKFEYGSLLNNNKVESKIIEDNTASLSFVSGDDQESINNNYYGITTIDKDDLFTEFKETFWPNYSYASHKVVKTTESIAIKNNDNTYSLCDYGFFIGGCAYSQGHVQEMTEMYIYIYTELDDVSITFNVDDTNNYGTISYNSSSFSSITKTYPAYTNNLDTGIFLKANTADKYGTYSNGNITVTSGDAIFKKIQDNKIILDTKSSNSVVNVEFNKTTTFYEINLTNSPGGQIVIYKGTTGTTTILSNQFEYGETYRFVATPDSGYNFKSWSYPGSWGSWTSETIGSENVLTFIFNGTTLSDNPQVSAQFSSTDESGYDVDIKCNNILMENSRTYITISKNKNNDDNYILFKINNNFTDIYSLPTLNYAQTEHCSISEDTSYESEFNYRKFDITNISEGAKVTFLVHATQTTLIVKTNNILFGRIGSADNESTTYSNIDYGDMSIELEAFPKTEEEINDKYKYTYNIDRFEITSGIGNIYLSGNKYKFKALGGNTIITAIFSKNKVPINYNDKLHTHMAQTVTKKISKCNFNCGMEGSQKGSQSVSGSGSGITKDSAISNAKSNAKGKGYTWNSKNSKNNNNILICGYIMNRDSVKISNVSTEFYSTGHVYRAIVSGTQSATRYVYMPGITITDNITASNVSSVNLVLNVAKTSTNTFYVCTKYKTESVPVAYDTNWCYSIRPNFIPNSNSITVNITDVFKYALTTGKEIYIISNGFSDQSFTIESASFEIQVASGSNLTEIKDCEPYIWKDSKLHRIIPFVMQVEIDSNNVWTKNGLVPLGIIQ